MHHKQRIMLQFTKNVLFKKNESCAVHQKSTKTRKCNALQLEAARACPSGL